MYSISEQKNKNEYIIIPKVTLNDSNINHLDKLLYGMIYSLSRTLGYCYASNTHLARELNVKVRTINYSLSKLKNNNYITIEYNYSDSSCKRKIFITNKAILQKVARVNEKTCNNDYEENCKYNNKYKNSKVNRYEPVMKYDTDGVMLWNGERCEVKELTPEDKNEMEELLKEFKEQ